MNALDPLWRLANLYRVKAADTGELVPFVPRAEQMEVFRAVHERKLKRIIILKARRLGISTGIDIMFTDMALSRAGFQASIVDQTQDDASKKLINICRVAFESIPEGARPSVLRINDSALELSCGDAPSAIYAGKNARGGTNQGLHLSEWGVIQADDARRSEEILTGAIPSAQHGIIIVETTWKGGKGGHLWELVKQAMETPDSEKSADDWHLFFFPWWTDPTSTTEDATTIEQDVEEYLNELETRIDRLLTIGQRRWYARRRRELGVFIWREYPSTVEECFRAPVEGAIYAQILDELRARRAIARRGIAPDVPVNTCWDLGAPRNTVCWYFQIIGREIRVVGCDKGLDMTAQQRAKHMLSKGYRFGWHYLPHDAEQTDRSGGTFRGSMEAAGITGCRVVPRTSDIWVGINRLREMMGERMTFRTPDCDEGLDALAAYHVKPETIGGKAVDMPVHDWSSHPSDGLRTLAEADLAGMLENSGGVSDAGLDRLDQLSTGKAPQGLSLTLQGGDRVLVETATGNDWLTVWEEPKAGCRYLISYGSRTEASEPCLLLLRDRYKNPHGADVNAAVIARVSVGRQAPVDAWATMCEAISKWSGACAVSIEIVGNERGDGMAMVELLKHRVSVVVRKRLGTTDQPENAQLGWLSDAASGAVTMGNLRRMVRENILDAWCPSLVRALRLSGESQSAEVSALAIGAHNLSAASMFKEPKRRRKLPSDWSSWV
jgi:hypothetical protein